MMQSFKDEIWILLAVLLAIAWTVVAAWFGLPKVAIYAGLGAIYGSYYLLHTGQYRRALGEYKKGKHEKALQICNTQMKRFPRDAYPYDLAASACLQMRRYEEAIEYSTEGIKRAGDFKHLLWVRADAKHQLRFFDKALDDVLTSIKYGQKEGGIFLLQAISLKGLFRYEEALKILESEQVQKQDATFVLLCKAHTLNEMNQSDAAFKTCSLAFQNISKELLCYGLTIRSLIYADLGRIEEAIKDITEVLEVEPECEVGYINRAYFRGRQGDIEGANADLDKLATFPKLILPGHLHSNRARTLLLCEKPAEALEQSNESLKVSYDPNYFLSTNGIMLLRNGLIDDALAALDKAIELDKYNSEAYWFRAELHEKMGNKEEAQKDRKVATDWGYIPYL